MPITTEQQEAARTRLARVRRLDPTTVLTPAARDKRSVRDATKGAFVRYKGELHRVVNKHRYAHGRWEWTELRLESVLTGGTAWIEWEVDDDVEVTESVRQLAFSDLRDEDGGRIDAGGVKQIAEDEDSVFYEGQEFEFEEEANGVRYYPDGASEPDKAKLRIVEFYAENDRSIAIETWVENGRGEHQVWLCQPVDPRSIEIVSLGAGD